MQQVWDYGSQRRVIVQIINQGTVYYLAALAVAIGFRMNLFNIGVDGQYRLAAFAAAVVGSQRLAAQPLHIARHRPRAMLVGAMWAGIAAVLKVTRGVSEVISTIMLNAIATSLIAYLLRQVTVDVAGSNNIGTKPIAESGAFPGIPLIPGSTARRLRLRRRRGARRRRCTPSSSAAPASASTCGPPGAPRPRPWPAASTSSAWSSSRC